MNLLPVLTKSVDLILAQFRFKGRIEGSFKPSNSGNRDYAVHVINTGTAPYTVRGISYTTFDVASNRDHSPVQAYSSDSNTPKSVPVGSAETFMITVEGRENLNYPISRILVETHHGRHFRGTIRDPKSERLFSISQFLFACINDRLKLIADITLDRWTFKLTVNDEQGFGMSNQPWELNLGQLAGPRRCWFSFLSLDPIESARLKEAADLLVRVMPGVFTIVEREEADHQQRQWLGLTSDFMTYLENPSDLTRLREFAAGGSLPRAYVENFIRFQETDR